MPSKKTRAYEWTCHACNHVHRANDSEEALPKGWTNAVTTVRGYTPVKMALDLCPACSKDPAAAIERFHADRS